MKGAGRRLRERERRVAAGWDDGYTGLSAWDEMNQVWGFAGRTLETMLKGCVRL